MKTSFLQYLLCPDCHGVDLRTNIFKGVEQKIESGLILCNSCRSWYPIVDSIPVVSTTPVIVNKWKQEIQKKWSNAFDFSGFKDASASLQSDAASSAQQEQIEFYDREAGRYDSEITDTVFWRSFAKHTTHKWASTEKARTGLVLEVGCGTGASTVALARSGCRVVALDICLSAAKVARDKIRGLNLTHAVDFIVSEAEALPFRPGLFQNCIFSGVLHHVASPIQVLKQISMALSNGGTLYGHENNDSAFRFFFDLLVKMKRLWHEEAGTHPLMKSREVKDWGRQAGLSIGAQSVVFLPPHFLNLFPQPIAENILLFTDRVLGWVPWIKDQGGLLIISGTKIPRGVKS